jgi:hypothetical protein
MFGWHMSTYRSQAVSLIVKQRIRKLGLDRTCDRNAAIGRTGLPTF